jgi:glycosyltransferase involved in cell wall biosynthesis
MAASAVRPIRILFVIGTLDIGGSERQLVEIASRLDRRRFSPTVCCLSDRGPLADALEAAGVPTVAVGFFSGRSARRMNRSRGRIVRLARWVIDTLMVVFTLPAGVARFLGLVRTCRPDVLHGILFHAYLLAAFAGVLTRVPVIVASRRSLSHFKARRPHFRAAERLANRWTDLVIANSDAVRLDAIRTEKLSPDRVIVIHNGVDPARDSGVDPAAARQSLELGDRPTAIVIANFLPYKDHAGLVGAWAAVCREVANACVLLVGDGPERVPVKDKVRALGLSQNVRFLGTRRDVPELLAAADLLIHPSLEEGFSNAILEAMAAGRPVVATDVGGNREAVSHGRTGWLVPPRDSAAMTAAILRILTDPSGARSMGAAGRARVLEEFQLNRMIDRYEATYQQLVTGPTVAR